MRNPSTVRGLALAAAAASLFTLVPLAVHADAGTPVLGNCYGVNACKGKSSCKTAENACVGKNSCKGHGFIDSVSADTCAQLGGRFSTEDPMKKK
jgi:hypothetical protein